MLILAFTQLCTRLFIIGPRKSYSTILLEPEIYYLIISTMLVAAAGYIINDYYDIKIDMINKPKRVVLGKTINRRIGLLMHLLLNTIAIGISFFFLSFNVSLFIITCQFLLWIYSNYFKRTPFIGNILISLLAFASLFIIGLFYKDQMNKIIFFGIFAFITNLIREIIKDTEDIEGDKTYGSNTLPILIGVKKTKNVLYALIFIEVSLLIYSYWLINNLLFGFLTAFVIIPFLYISYLTFKADNPGDFSRLSAITKVIMVFGIMSMVLI
ncbi:MAG: geranylgeranylglycerol-phosphate geranylgeranyltransferase [Bacteroidota bacterium]|nr:geranylgeranylglycerol-phosphate geranylgeranyltransferase [Bacteroidota bacterium]